MDRALLQILEQCLASRQPCALAMVIGISGSSAAALGDAAVFDAQGRLLAGWVGGGCAESLVGQSALEAIATGNPSSLELDMTTEASATGMPCGGAAQVFIRPCLPPDRVWLFGHGAIAEHTAAMADSLGFDVVISDPLATQERFPTACAVHFDDYTLDSFQPAPDDHVIIATQHKGDQRILSHALRHGARSVALVASRQRGQLVLEALAQEGFSAHELACIRTPAGLDIGAVGPAEIALSILAEIIAIRRPVTCQGQSAILLAKMPCPGRAMEEE
jgi:xanthine dehydrogenase accessory factor